MKVLFVWTYESIPLFSSGLGSISALLKKHGHATRMTYFRKPEDSSQLLRVMDEFSPDVAAFSAITSHFAKVKRVSSIIKENKKDTYTVCGGVHPTLNPECLEKTTDLDAICRGEGEFPMLELMEKMEQGRIYLNVKNFWFRKNGKILKNDLRPLIQNLDDLPIPDHELFRSAQLPGGIAERGDFIFSRGCPFQCTYCCNHAIKNLYNGQKYVRYPSVDRAIQELGETTQRYGIREVVIHDDVMTLNKRWLSEFCDKYKASIKLPFLCNVRPGTCDRETFQMLRAGGCQRVAIGIESGSEFIREKVLNRKMSQQEILDCFSMAHGSGLSTYSFNMIGLPYETPSRFRETISINAKLGEKNTPWLNVFHPYPNTLIYRTCAENGLINGPVDDFSMERRDSVLSMPQFPRRKIRKFFRDFELWVEMERIASRNGTSKLLQMICRLPLTISIARYHGFMAKIMKKGISNSLRLAFSEIRRLISNLSLTNG